MSSSPTGDMHAAMLPLVLASTSPYRRQLLDRLGVPYSAVAPACDEDALKQALTLAPADLALRLAQEKAESLRARFPDAVIIGGDQLVELDGDALGKPGSEAGALAQLRRLRGRAHRLLTAMVVIGPDGLSITHLDTHTLVMADHDDDALRRYVAHDQPLDCAGSYKIEALGISLFRAIAGDDFTAIPGLPLLALSRALRRFGFDVP